MDVTHFCKSFSGGTFHEPSKKREMISDDVWLHNISLYCTFDTWMSLFKVNHNCQNILEKHLDQYIHNVYNRHRLQAKQTITEETAEWVQCCLTHNIWTESRYLDDTVSITFNKLIALATDCESGNPMNKLLQIGYEDNKNLTPQLVLCNYAGELTPLQLFMKLMERFEPQFSGEEIYVSEERLYAIRLSVIDFLLLWTESDLVKDFKIEHPENYVDLILNTVQPFIYYMSLVDWRKGCALRKCLVEQWKELHKMSKFQLTEMNYQYEKEDLYDNYSVEEIAHVLSIIDCINIEKLCRSEFSGKRWDKPVRHLKAPYLNEMVQSSNKLHFWIYNKILSYSDLEQRAECLEKFIRVATVLFETNSFHSYHAVINAITASSIIRLKLTWKQVDPLVTKKYTHVTSLTHPEWKYRKYIERLKQQNIEFIPFIFRYITSCSFVEEGYRGHNGYYLNVTKMDQMTNVFESFIRPYQSHSLLKSKPHVLQRALYLFHRNIHCIELVDPENEFYQRSIQLEP
jgi:hypothetical protein